jgi:hypothetical protein
VFSNTANEQSGISNVHLANVTQYGVWYYSDPNNGSPQNWYDHDLDIILDNSASSSAACYKATGSSSLQVMGRVMSGLTCRPTSSAVSSVGVQIDGYEGGGMAGIHCELVATCLDLGETLTNKGLDFFGISGGPSLTNLVVLKNIASTSSNYSILLSGLSVQSGTNIIDDEMCGTNASPRILTDASLPIYIVGNGGATAQPNCFTESTTTNVYPDFSAIDFRNNGPTEQARIRLATSSNDVVFSSASGNLDFRPLGDTVSTDQVQININGQIYSSETAHAPFLVSSSAPVSTLTVSNHPQYYLAGVQTPSVMLYTDSVPLSGGTASFTFQHSFAFSNTNYLCQATDISSPAAASAVALHSYSVTVNGTGSDMIAISCSGN